MALTMLNKKKKEEDDDYTATGMSIGMCICVAIGSSLMGTFGRSALTYGLCFGMLGGMMIGTFVSKK